MKKNKIIKIVALLLSILVIIFVIIMIFFKKNHKADLNEIGKNTVISELGKLAEKDELDEVDGFYYWHNMDGNYMKLKENATREEREKMYKYHQDEKGTLFEMCKKNGDWSLIPCDTDLLGYNEKDGLLGDFTFDSIERIDNNATYENSYILVKAKNGDTERIYRIRYSWSDGTFTNIYVDLEEENDIKNNEKIKINVKLFNNDNIRTNFEELCLDGEKRIMYPQEEWDGTYHGDNIAVSDNFRKKYPYFLDLFIHYSPLEYNHIKLIDFDTEKQVATFEVDSILECKKRVYEVSYKLADNLYLDDAEVGKINEINYEADSTNDIFKIIFKNSNWDKIDITNNFRKKYNEDDGVFSKANFTNAYFAEGVHKDNNSYLYCLEFDNNKNYYAFEIIEDSNGYIDDVKIEDLAYGNIPMEEAIEKYKKQFMSN